MWALSPAKPVIPTEAPLPTLPCSSPPSSLPSLCGIPDSDAPPNLCPAPSPPYLCRNSASPPRQQWAIRSPNSWLMRGARSVCSSSSCKVGGGEGERGGGEAPLSHLALSSWFSFPSPPLPHTRPGPGCSAGPPGSPSAPRPPAALGAGLPGSGPAWGGAEAESGVPGSPSLALSRRDPLTLAPSRSGFYQ